MELLITIGLTDNLNHLRVVRQDIEKKLLMDDNLENEINELWMIINSLNETRNNLIQFKK